MAISQTILAFLICFLITLEPFGTYGFSIKLIPRDQFDTTLFPKSLTPEERYQRISEISRAHIYQLESMVSTSSMDRKESIQPNPSALQPPVAMGNHNYYLTTLSVGSRPYSPNLVVDTGSVDTWMQCEGCRRCFFNRQGNFNTSQSQSYQLLPCSDPLCVPHLCQSHVCMYDQTYLGSRYGHCYSMGQVGSDTFTFNNRGSSNKFPHTVFGCGLDNFNLGWEKSGQNNNIAGIFGLGLGKRSIFMQYANETKNRISYCLPSLDNRGAFTYLHFGDDAQIDRRHGFRSTRLIPNVTQYAVNVIGISTNNKRLNIEPQVFRMRPDHTGGFILDSGIPHTALVRSAYNVVRAEIVEYFLRRYTWHPLPPQPDQLDLCYNMPHRNFTAPNMTYHFEAGSSTGNTLDLPERNVFQFFNASFCLMAMPISDPGPSKLGAFQQANFRFLFDFTRLTVLFGPENCGRS